MKSLITLATIMALDTSTVALPSGTTLKAEPGCEDIELPYGDDSMGPPPPNKAIEEFVLQ